MTSNQNPFEILSRYEALQEDSTKIIQGIHVDFTKIKEKRYVVKKLYQILTNRASPTDSNSVQWRIIILQYLENSLRTQFSNARTFKRKVEAYLEGYEVRSRPVGELLRKTRKKKKWSQKDLAKHLGYASHVPITNFERGLRYPPKKVLQWLKEEQKMSQKKCQ